MSLSFKGFQEALEGLGVHFVILSTSGEGDGTHFSQLPNVEDSTSGFRKCEFPEVSWCFKVVLKLLNLKAESRLSGNYHPIYIRMLLYYGVKIPRQKKVIRV